MPLEIALDKLIPKKTLKRKRFFGQVVCIILTVITCLIWVSWGSEVILERFTEKYALPGNFEYIG